MGLNLGGISNVFKKSPEDGQVLSSQGPRDIYSTGIIVWKGAWAATSYIANDGVLAADGNAYICILAHTNQEPPNATYWDVLAEKGIQGAQGDQGIQGIQGAQGDQGIQGIQGIPGVIGSSVNNSDLTEQDLTTSYAVINGLTAKITLGEEALVQVIWSGEFSGKAKAVTNYWSCSGYHFTGTSPDTNDITYGTSGRIRVQSGTPLLVGQVELPNGAVITSATVFGNDASEKWKLRRIDQSDGSTDDLASESINTADTSISNATVDNSTYGYHFYTENFDANNAIYGAIIAYTFLETQDVDVAIHIDAAEQTKTRRRDGGRSPFMMNTQGLFTLAADTYDIDIRAKLSAGNVGDIVSGDNGEMDILIFKSA